jgi:succinate dehydrogenase hydrophobic anchor subunit
MPQRPPMYTRTALRTIHLDNTSSLPVRATLRDAVIVLGMLCLIVGVIVVLAILVL